MTVRLPADQTATNSTFVSELADDKRGLYLSVLQEMDRQLGKLFDFIRNDESLRKNTVVLVCSDEGACCLASIDPAGPWR